jgi:hypothetical protein
MLRASWVSIVEGDRFFRESRSRPIRSLGYKVEAFPSAADFLASARLVDTACLIAAASSSEPRITQTIRDFVYLSMSGDGSPMYVKASGKPMFDRNGEFRGYRGAGADVTEPYARRRSMRGCANWSQISLT